MVVDPSIYEAIEGVDGEGFLEPNASELEVGAAVGGLQANAFESAVTEKIADFLTNNGLETDELTEPLLELMVSGLRIMEAVKREIPFPGHRPIEGKLEINDLTTDAADAVPVNPAHRHFMQRAAGVLLDELQEAEITSPENRTDAYLPIFRALVDASDLGYRARFIETM